MEQRVQCLHCRHYYITWDKDRPYGCKRLGFKAPIEPALIVRQTSGTACLAFERKPPRGRG